MGEMLRSDPMTFFDMYLQPETAFEIISQLGEVDCVQFNDSNTAVSPLFKHYISEVCRCEEMERKLRYIESEMVKDKIYIPELKEKEPSPLQFNEMIPFEAMLEQMEYDILMMSGNQTDLMKNYLELTEMLYVLTHIGPMLGDAECKRESILSKASAGDGLAGQLVVIAGVVRRQRMFNFELMVWRISRGNIFFRPANEDKILQDPYTGQDIRKVAFLAICQGEELTSRMNKVVSGFRVNKYPCPTTAEERAEAMELLEIRLADLEQIIKKSKYHRCKSLRAVGRDWRAWMIEVRKAKAVYHTMNMFNMDITRKCLIGQCWIPDKDIKSVQHVLKSCSKKLGTNVPSFMLKTTPGPYDITPTYHRVNKFTRGFQALISAYGDSEYRELNPGLYTIITFPFLFALMFGDVGHGIILLVFAYWMVKNEKKFMAQRSTNEIWTIFFGGRYVMLLLGIFSAYTGFIYNDWFSRKISITQSYWQNVYREDDIKADPSLELDPKLMTNPVYKYGMDPIWGLAKNKIMFENSIKMKLSIIVGIIHMMFGIVLSLFNYIYFQRRYSIILQFIPEFLFLTCVFFWLVILIFYKWFNYDCKTTDVKAGSSCAPQVLILFIDMMLFKTTKAVDPVCDAYMFAGQQTIQRSLVLLSLLCVPLLLLGTPIYHHKKNKKMLKIAERKLHEYESKTTQDLGLDNVVHDTLIAQVNKHKVPFSDLLIHQGVHTIEFVLSTISHTASYLRLWALSLAHAQLSDMLWAMILSKLALQDHSIMGALKLFIIFAIWAAFTISILVVMEGLSAFLHTLRLHWVEFMSKFFGGGGKPFHPLSFKELLASDIDKKEGACKKKKDHNFNQQ